MWSQPWDLCSEWDSQIFPGLWPLGFPAFFLPWILVEASEGLLCNSGDDILALSWVLRNTFCWKPVFVFLFYVVPSSYLLLSEALRISELYWWVGKTGVVLGRECAQVYPGYDHTWFSFSGETAAQRVVRCQVAKAFCWFWDSLHRACLLCDEESVSGHISREQALFLFFGIQVL